MGLLSSPTVAALHSIDVSLTPERSLENTEIVYTLVIQNTGGDNIENITLAVPEGFTGIIENETPTGWSFSWNPSDNTITYVSTGDEIPAGEFRYFKFKGTTPDLPSGFRNDYPWEVTTRDDNGGIVSENLYTGVVPAIFSTTGYSDVGEDTDDDNLYNYLIVNVPVLVSTSGYYWVGGSLYENASGDYITWGKWEYMYLDNGVQLVQQRFSGLRIRQAQENGYYRAELWLEDDEWQELDRTEYVTSNFYYWENFETPPAEILRIENDFGENLDNDSYYEYLVVEVGLNIYESGTYQVSGSLYDNEWGYITWGEAEKTYLEKGENRVQVRFDGTRIRAARKSGQYRMDLYLYDENWNWISNYENWTQNSYNWEDFELPGAEIVGVGNDYGEDTNSDGYYEYLVVNVELNVAKAGTYRVSGSLYENGTWDYITWADTEMSLGTETQTLQLRFDGSRIRSERVSGYYRVSVNLWDDLWNWLSQEENVIGPYQWENFQPPAAEILWMKDNALDSDNDNFYDVLEVEIGLQVNTAGTFEVSGSLYGDGEYIAWAWKESSLKEGQQTIKLEFDGSRIRAEKVSGIYSVYTSLYQSDGYWKWLGSIENDIGYYSWENFEPPAAEIVRVYDDNVDQDNDNFYDYLLVRVDVEANKPGTYRVDGYLVENSTWEWITWSESTTIDCPTAGAYTAELLFDGSRIRSEEVTGYYKAMVYLYDEYWGWLDRSENVIGHYSWENFEPPGLEVSEITDSGVDGPDNDNYFDYLAVDVTFKVNRAGEYRVSASLYGSKWWTWLGHDWAENYLDENENTMRLEFDGVNIYSGKENGPYRVSIWVSDENWKHVLDNEHLTQVYSFENFQRPPATIVGIGPDYGVDTDGDGNYNYLCVEVRVDVQEAGTYELSGWLRDNEWYYIGWGDNEVDLEAGDNQILRLYFEGYKIRGSKRFSPYRVEVDLYQVREEEWYWWRSLDSGTYTTIGVYSPENFDQPPIEFTSSSFDNAVDTDGDGYYDFLVINVGVRVSENGRYRISGSLYTEWLERENEEPRWPVWIDWADNEFELSASEEEQIVQLSFSGVSISRSGENGPYRADFYLSGERERWWSWYGGSSHVTETYYASDFQPVPVQFVKPYSDYGEDTDGDNLYDFLVVEVGVDVKKAGEYIISGSLWPGNAYVMKDVTLDVGEQTVTLKFSGSQIYMSESSGSFYAYFGILDKSWEWFDWDCHKTSSYSYEQFDPPKVELVKVSEDWWREKIAILDEAVDEYPDNENLYDSLVIDVKVNVRENGTYKVRATLGPDKDSSFDWVENTVSLTIDDNSVQLRFDGYAIVKRKLSGQFWLWIVVSDTEGNWLDSGWSQTETRYSYESFEDKRTRNFAIVVKDLGTASAGEVISVELENTDLANVTDIELKTKDDITQPATLDVVEHETPPPGAKDTGGEELRYVDITVTDASKIEESVIRFKVAKSAVTSLGLDVNEIALMRYNESSGDWIELETTLENQDDNYYYFSATTPGFSWFVVIGRVYQPEEEVPPAEEEVAVVVEEVVVKEEAIFEFSVFEIPDVITIGENVTITFIITNTGNIEGTYTIVLTLDGMVLETREVTLAAGENREVSFVVVPTATGTFYITIAGQTAELVVAPEIIVSQELISIEVPEIYVSKITIDTPAVFDISETSITQIAVSVVREVENVILKIRQLKDKPEEISAPEGIVHAYLEILAEKLSNADISTATITFKVERSWIKNQNIDETTITLYRYHAGEWQPLTTEKGWEDEEYIYFTAMTPGFSVFAIAGFGVEVEAPPAVLPTVPAVYPTVPAPVGPPLYLVILAAIALVAVIVAIIWRYISIGAKGLPKA
jgi:PGF-pre-PGF domain-containing protein